MSRKTVLWRKKIGSAWTVKTNKGSKTMTSGNRGRIDGLIPTHHVKGDGTFLYDKEKGRYGVGNTVTLPMNPEKAARIERLVKK